MTDTRMVRLEQIAAFFDEREQKNVMDSTERAIKFNARHGETPTFCIQCKQVGDATGGDVYQAIGPDAAMVYVLRRAKWPHLVQVEVVNG